MEYDGIEEFITKRFTEYMKLFQISVNKLHEVLGVARSTVQRYLDGKTTPPMHFIDSFLRYIQVDYDVFFEPYSIKKRVLA